MPIMQRCGTGNTGCTCQNPAINYMLNGHNMCNGVFKPVCAPEICNVPRIPHHEILAEGQGILLDTISWQEIRFNLMIERTMQLYSGSLILQSPWGYLTIKSPELKFFESDGDTHLLAIFYDEPTGRDITVTIHQNDTPHSTQIFIHSASIVNELINLNGIVVSGDIELYADHNVHEH